ncbi:MAG: hypothetical protein KBD64_00060 [Gammaproteobacteria bacterium]|nr:hypothetical protein [Gammaproteobacteria bacterium]
MKTEPELIVQLEQQIAKIEQFVIDLQKDNKWQQIFYRKKLFLSLNNVFKNNYTDYNKYLEDIVKDYRSLKSNQNDLFKIYFINKIETKIFALFKVLRNLKKYNKTATLAVSKSDYQQHTVSKLMHEQDSLQKMLKLLSDSYNNLNKQLVYGNGNQQLDKKQSEQLTNKLLAILGKKGRIERELFSVVERLRLFENFN